MRNIPTKVDNIGDELSAAEYNSTQDELENAVTSTDQTLDVGSDSDLNMLGKAIRIYTTCGQTYAESGTANAYVLATSINLKPVPTYKDGMTVTFKAQNANTGASTISVDGLAAKSLTQYDGSTLDANNVNTNDFVTAIYSSANDRFELKGIVDTQFASGTALWFPQTTAPVGWTRVTSYTDNAMLCYAQTGTPGTGGSANPQSAHTHTGPSHTHTLSHTHTHTHTHTGPNHYHTTSGHTLTISEIPSHSHYASHDNGYNNTGVVALSSANYIKSGADYGDGRSYYFRGITSSPNAGLVSYSGSGGSHSHGNTGYSGTGSTGAASTSTTSTPSTSTTSASGTGATGSNTAPAYIEGLIATKD